MRAGALDRPVQFRRATMHDDGLGQVEDWLDHGAPVWAAKRDVSDAERWRGGEVQAHLTTRFVVRWSPFTADLTPRDRLVCEGREYEIAGIKETEGRRRGLEITAAVRTD
jgi:SPP1 family predicted phage head-tail adaptor